MGKQRGIQQVVVGEIARIWPNGFPVRRVIGGPVEHWDPVVNYFHAGPFEYKPKEALGACDHVHRGFEIVTFIAQGAIEHFDSKGHAQELTEGWCQWIRVGKGIMHAEMPTKECFDNGGVYETFQMNMILPKSEMFSEPDWCELPPEKVPVANTPDGKVSVKVISGECMGVKAVIQTKQPLIYYAIYMQPGSTFTTSVPENHKGLLYMWKGSAKLSGTVAEETQTALLADSGTDVTIEAIGDKEVRVMLLAAVPTNDPIYKEGPFIMNTKEDIQQCFADLKLGKFPAKPAGWEERAQMITTAVDTQKQNGVWDEVVSCGWMTDGH